jgi:hypothetical protein
VLFVADVGSVYWAQHTVARDKTDTSDCAQWVPAEQGRP